MQQKSFYLVGHWVIDHKNFYELLKNVEVATLVLSEAKRRTAPHNALAYYVNNVVSIAWAPKRVWSFACDISYWVTNDTKQDLSDLIWFIIDEMWYFDYVDENDRLLEVTDEVFYRKEQLFINRLEKWFWCIMKNWKGLPRWRRIDKPTETTSS